MTSININDSLPMKHAIQIAKMTLDGDYDLLLACRELSGLRGQLPNFAGDAMDVFSGVASEIDGMPIGSERQYWAEDALKVQDVKAANYRGLVTDVVRSALWKFLAALSEVRRG